MNREIKIIKRVVGDLKRMEPEKTVLSQARNAEVVSPLQLARTIEEWVRMHKQKAREELAAAQSLRAAL